MGKLAKKLPDVLKQIAFDISADLLIRTEDPKYPVYKWKPPAEELAARMVEKLEADYEIQIRIATDTTFTEDRAYDLKQALKEIARMDCVCFQYVDGRRCPPCISLEALLRDDRMRGAFDA